MRALLVVLVACGGGNKPQARVPVEPVGIALEPGIGYQVWYRAPTICGQGPYEIEVPVSGVKWGEEIELAISTPRRVAITAVIVADDAEVARTAGSFDRDGRGTGTADNRRCVAEREQRIAAVRDHGGPAGNAGGGGDVPVGTTVVPPPATPQRLEIEELVPARSIDVVRFGWRDHGRRQRIRIRFWSTEPNDLEGVRFGVVRFDWRPNVSEAEYEAFVAERERRARWQRELAARATVTVESRHDAETQRRKRAADDERRMIEADRERERRAIEAARELERRRRREAYCAARPENRDCWGAGGKTRFAELEAYKRERERYCAATPADVRCWTAAERAHREEASRKRIADALAPKLPDGPPPAPRDETPPPRLSENAEWRPGYWQWTGATWVWLAGMWRVPEADIALEKTTTAPVAPPPPQPETPPPPPMRATVWVSGFWQWNGATHVWIPGSYQLRPEAGVVWQPTEWRVRGSVHVLIPGRWIQVRR